MNTFSSAAKAAAHKRAALAQLAGKKEKHLARADELWDAQQGNRAAAKIRGVEHELTAGHHLDLFVTPIWLADDMVARCDDPFFHNSLFCEPSAGTGRIVQALLDAGRFPSVVELSYNAAQHLQKKFPTLTVFNRDFLEMGAPEQIIPASTCYDCTVTPPTKSHAPEEKFIPHLADVFVMNPPFSHGQDIAHVQHAYKYLSEGGRIVAIMSEAAFYQDYNRAKQFRAWFDEVCGQSEKLPAGTFKESGTMTSTRIVTIDK